MTQPACVADLGAMTIRELALDQEALRLAWICCVCPQLNPTELDAETHAHLNVINALLAAKQAIAVLTELLAPKTTTETACLGTAMKTKASTTPMSGALTNDEQNALGRLLVGRLLDTKPSKLSALWGVAAQATNVALRSEMRCDTSP